MSDCTGCAVRQRKREYSAKRSSGIPDSWTCRQIACQTSMLSLVCFSRLFYRHLLTLSTFYRAIKRVFEGATGTIADEMPLSDACRRSRRLFTGRPGRQCETHVFNTRMSTKREQGTFFKETRWNHLLNNQFADNTVLIDGPPMSGDGSI